MTTLITGATGWLGTRLLEIISDNSHEWVTEKRKIRCFILAGEDVSKATRFGAEVIEGDLRKISHCRKAVKNVKTIFHLAGIVHPRRRIKELYENNRDATKNLITAAAEVKVKRFIYVSSNSPAGHNQKRYFLFTDNEVNPYMNYGKSKLQAEQIIKQFYKSGEIETVILRPCWFYGPNQPLRQTKFFRMIKKGNPFVFGHGYNLRSLSYVDNTVHALLLAEKAEVANGQTYWIADRKPYTQIEIYETIAKLLGVRNFSPRFVPNIISNFCMLGDSVIQAFGLYSSYLHVAGEMIRNIACSIEKAEAELGYKPSIELEEGMRRSIEWCREQNISI
jgi:nucleoside-diphosphate-sugar epimerase